MRYFLSLLLWPALMLLSLDLQAQNADLIKNTFGPNVEVVGGAKPTELKGDFNGDGLQDIAVLVTPKGKRGDLAPGVTIALTSEGARPLDPASVLNGKNSLAVIHGSASGLQSPQAKYLIYDFGWIGWKGPENGTLVVIPKAEQKKDRKGYLTLAPNHRVGLPDVNKGAVIVVPTDANINTVLYWDGSKYRFWIAPGEAD